MAKKEYIPVMALAVASVCLLGFLGCGLACLTLGRALNSQRHELLEARAQIMALNQALEAQRRELSETREQLAAAISQIADAQQTNRSLAQRLMEMQSKSSENKAVTEASFPPVQVPAFAPDVPAPDSIEGKLRAEGKMWERSNGQPIAGGYVLDILQGRTDQPKGRGRLGMVLSMAANPEGRPVATVDFGHGYVVGISTAELSPVRLVGTDMR